METNTLTFNNLEKALTNFLNDFVSTYKSLLIRDNKKASGDLINSIKALNIEFNTTKYTGSISLKNYWKYVEYGRKPGKFPPPKKILNWVKVKKILPKPVKGIKPTEKQLAFLISRKIARDGIKPGNQFSEALNLVWTKYEKIISDAITKDLSETIDIIKL